MKTVKGVDLMYKDSVMSEMVLLNFAHKGIACLPVHDSFIVDIRHSEELITVMKSAFKVLYEQEPKISLKPKQYDDYRAVAKQDFERTIAEYPAEHRDEVRQTMLDAGEAPFITRYSRYEKMLKEFSIAKSVELEDVADLFPRDHDEYIDEFY